jgi:hypothetical protein
MDFTHPQARSYLQELFSATSGNPDTEASMYDIGSVIGLERSDAGALAEELIVEGLLELRNLSGGVSITRDGIRAIDMQVAGAAGGDVLHLGSDPVLSGEGRVAVEQVVSEIQKEIPTLQTGYEGLEQLVIDIKTLQVQLLSPRPGTEIIREILHSISGALENGGGEEIGGKIKQMISG